MENIRVAAEAERAAMEEAEAETRRATPAEAKRAAMEEAEAETRRATRKWRQYTVWLATDSKERGLPKGSNTRRLAKAKLVWWGSQKAGGWRVVHLGWRVALDRV